MSGGGSRSYLTKDVEPASRLCVHNKQGSERVCLSGKKISARQESNRQVKEVFREFLRTVREKYPRISAETDIFLGHELVFHEELPERPLTAGW